MKHPYLVWLSYLVASQYVVNATIEIIDPFDGIIDTFTNTEATVIDDILKGYIESADPPDACTSIALPSVPANATMKKMVLVNGTSECDLLTKLQNVVTVGYDVAIVFNPFPELFDYNITFPIPKSKVNLSAVTVLYEDGILIKNNYLFHIMSDKDNPVIQIDPSDTWSMIGAIGVMLFLITFTATLVMGCGGLVYRCFQKLQNCWNRNNNEPVRQREEDPPQIPAPVSQRSSLISPTEYGLEGAKERLTRSFNKKLPSVQYSEVYHPDCIDQWVLEYGAKDKTCPLCKRKVMFQTSCEEVDPVATEVTPLLGSSCPSWYVSVRPGGSSQHHLYSSDFLPGSQGSINHGAVSDEDY